MPGRVQHITEIRLPMEPDGTKRAASRSKISAARACRRLTVGSSPYTSSPTSASAMARRMAGVGLVTVSLRRSTMEFGSLIGALLSGGAVKFARLHNLRQEIYQNGFEQRKASQFDIEMASI